MHASNLTATGVYFQDSTGRFRTARLKAGGEVILTAGALATPPLLMLSGIGPYKKLHQHRIPQLLDLPAVGHNITDIPITVINVLSPNPVELSSLQVVGIGAKGNIVEGASGGNHTLCWAAGGQLNFLPHVFRGVADLTMNHMIHGRAAKTLNQAGFLLSKVGGWVVERVRTGWE